MEQMCGVHVQMKLLNYVEFSSYCMSIGRRYIICCSVSEYWVFLCVCLCSSRWLVNSVGQYAVHGSLQRHSSGHLLFCLAVFLGDLCRRAYDGKFLFSAITVCAWWRQSPRSLKGYLCFSSLSCFLLLVSIIIPQPAAAICSILSTEKALSAHIETERRVIRSFYEFTEQEMQII